MKRQIKRWLFRLMVTALFIVGLLLLIVLNPILTYANKTKHNNYTIFHNKLFDPSLTTTLDQATELLKTSEFYNPSLRLHICLNDGSKYPKIIKLLRGRAFAWGFYNKVVLQGTANVKDNYVEVNGYKWNMTQLLAHEMTHCLQFDKLGFWRSKPIARIPNWKWEGYAEYISRKNSANNDLAKNIVHLNQTDKNNWAVEFNDGTIVPREYYEYWLLMQFCLDIQKKNYIQVLADTAREQTVKIEMMNWYKQNSPAGK